MQKKRVLYLGLEPPPQSDAVALTHFPIIEIVSLIHTPEVQSCIHSISEFTDIIFTSKVAVRLLANALETIPTARILAVGHSTAQELQKAGFAAVDIAREETAEGILTLLKEKPSHHHSPFFFWPHSALSRPVIGNYLNSQGQKFRECHLYNTITTLSNVLPDLESFDTIFFTSPSTVDAFIDRYGKFPETPELKAIGPVTQLHLDKIRDGRDFVPLLHSENRNARKF